MSALVSSVNSGDFLALSLHFLDSSQYLVFWWKLRHGKTLNAGTLILQKALAVNAFALISTPNVRSMTTNISTNSDAVKSTFRNQAHQLDQNVHAWLSKASMGLSPISLSLAYLDWALHLTSSPGQQMLLMQEAWASLPKYFSPQQEEKDAPFLHEAWQNWPFNA